MRVRGDTFGEMFIQKFLQNQLFVQFDEVANLGKAFKDAYNLGGWLIFQELLNEWVIEVVTFDPHDFTKEQLGAYCPNIYLYCALE